MAENSSSDVSWVEQNKIVGNANSFAVIKAEGSVFTWGGRNDNGSANLVEIKISSGVEKIFANGYAFAVIKKDGSVIILGMYF